MCSTRRDTLGSIDRHRPTSFDVVIRRLDRGDDDQFVGADLVSARMVVDRAPS
jgi:hypothetical protein